MGLPSSTLNQLGPYTRRRGARYDDGDEDRDRDDGWEATRRRLS
jgi:hypothetical protein